MKGRTRLDGIDSGCLGTMEQKTGVSRGPLAIERVDGRRSCLLVLWGERNPHGDRRPPGPLDLQAGPQLLHQRLHNHQDYGNDSCTLHTQHIPPTSWA
jgi:hypothetical protein